MAIAAAASTAISTAPQRCVPSSGAAMSPSVSSSSLKSTRGLPATGPAPSASRLPTQAGRRSKAAYRVPSRFMREDVGELGEQFFHDLWDDNNIADDHQSEGGKT